VNVDVLKALVGDRTVTDADEKYGLTWHGKRRARELALTPSTGTLRPCPEDSVDWDATQNLIIEGDNLEVLKLLQKSYAGRVKLIYIDPPYNTGKDFIYQDNFHDNIRHYLELTGQARNGWKVSSNTEASGRFHTTWLNMMYPRLRLARIVLREDGVIFVSCDDNEIHSLRQLMNEVFGEENFIASVIWQKVYSPKNSARHFSEDHDYIVVYGRHAEVWRPELLARTADQDTHYANPDNDPRGLWMSDNLSARNYYGEGIYAVTSPSGRVIEGPPHGRYWGVAKERFLELDRDERIWWGKDGNGAPRLKRFLSEVKRGRVPQTFWPYSEVGHTQDAKKQLMEHVTFEQTENVLDTVKPTGLIRRMLQLATQPAEGDLILDFFAGSGSTGHAVFEQNHEDGGNRRFVLVQFPEPLPMPETQLRTIADITEERIRSISRKLGDENASRLNLNSDRAGQDLGFRVFKLDSSNIRAWEPDRDDLDQTLLDSVEHMKEGRTEADVLYELLLRLGLDLCVPIERRAISGKDVHAVGGGVLIACLAERIDRGEVEALAQGVVEWHKALAPAGDTTCVFRDSAFADDVAKTNLAAILEQQGIANVRSL
jgi:adenine-specific DNA-methyltransferase